MVAAVASLFVNHSWLSLDRFLGGGKLIRLAMANIDWLGLTPPNIEVHTGSCPQESPT